MWGTDEGIESYLTQTFVRKIQSKFGEKLIIEKESSKGGNIVYPQGMSFDEAKSRLKNLKANEDEVRRTALVL